MNNCKFCEQPLPHGFWGMKKKQKSDRAKEGLREAKARGKHIGRPFSAPHHRILELRSQGFSYGKIAKELGIPRSTVQSSLLRIKT